MLTQISERERNTLPKSLEHTLSVSDHVSVRYLRNLSRVDKYVDRTLHVTTLRPHVGKSVQDVGELVCWEVLRVMVPTIDSP